MFEVGKRYWVVNGDSRLKAWCIGRGFMSATFMVNDRDMLPWMKMPTFTRKIDTVDVPDENGRPREYVASLDDDLPGRDWYVIDQEVETRKDSTDGEETRHVGARGVGQELSNRGQVEPRGVEKLWRRLFDR